MFLYVVQVVNNCSWIDVSTMALAMLCIEGIMCNGQKRKKKMHGRKHKKIPL